MEFSEWIQQIRKARGLDAREFALKTGVDPSTISRIEHQKTEATLYTVYRICESMGVSLAELIYTLLEKEISLPERSNQKESEKFVTLKGIEKVVDDYVIDRISINQKLAQELNDLSTQMSLLKQRMLFDEVEYHSLYSENEIDRYVYWSPLSAKYELKYPQQISYDHIFLAYIENGALMFRDVEVYLRKYRFKMGRLGQYSLNRGVSTSSMERIRLADVLQLYSESKDAIILDMFWEASRFYSKFSFPEDTPLHRERIYRDFGKIDFDEWRLNLAIFYITIHRWKASLDFGYSGDNRHNF